MWPPLLPGPDLGMEFPPLGGAPDTSTFLRSSLKGSSFFDGLSVTTQSSDGHQWDASMGRPQPAPH